jgi:hypothetical protein
MLQHSARRAARRVRRRARALLEGAKRVEELARALAGLAEALHRHCRVASRKAVPSTLDRLTALDPEFDQAQEEAA